jgi:hypothetical protein
MVVWQRFFRIAYSYVAGAESLAGILTTSMASMRILSMISL